MKKYFIFNIEDYDFGTVPVYYYPEENAIIADSLVVIGVPSDYEETIILKAWDSFKCHYGTYGTMVVLYETIPVLEEQIAEN